MPDLDPDLVNDALFTLSSSETAEEHALFGHAVVVPTGTHDITIEARP